LRLAEGYFNHPSGGTKRLNNIFFGFDLRLDLCLHPQVGDLFFPPSQTALSDNSIRSFTVSIGGTFSEPSLLPHIAVKGFYRKPRELLILSVTDGSENDPVEVIFGFHGFALPAEAATRNH
jgi:hypothetical protein